MCESAYGCACAGARVSALSCWYSYLVSLSLYGMVGADEREKRLRQWMGKAINGGKNGNEWGPAPFEVASLATFWIWRGASGGCHTIEPSAGDPSHRETGSMARVLPRRSRRSGYGFHEWRVNDSWMT